MVQIYFLSNITVTENQSQHNKFSKKIKTQPSFKVISAETRLREVESKYKVVRITQNKSNKLN
jgi:hypothetical protein